MDMKFGDMIVQPGEKKSINLSAGRLYDFTELNLNLRVIRGKKEGPVLFISAAIHGDEINGVEIIRRLLQQKALRGLRGTLIAVPVVNIFGFNNRSRYLPDRRDLNRCFPGSEKGSLAARLAHLFMKEIVSKATHGIDLHTASVHRRNLPQIRASLKDPQTEELAHSFGVPVVLNSTLRDGSLRQAASDRNIHMLLYEGGEALRFEESVIKLGVRGILSVMAKIGMISNEKALPRFQKRESYTAKNSYWVRAPESGILKKIKRIGAHVKEGDLLAMITSPYGEHRVSVRALHPGIIIGISVLPLMNRGDAAYHIATFEEDLDDIKETVELLGEDFIDVIRPSF